MAALANTVLTTAAVGNREELSNIVSMITPTDTPIYSMAGKEKADSKHPEWEYEALRAPAENAQPEGNEFDFDAQVAPTAVIDVVPLEDRRTFGVFKDHARDRMLSVHHAGSSSLSAPDAGRRPQDSSTNRAISRSAPGAWGCADRIPSQLALFHQMFDIGTHGTRRRAVWCVRPGPNRATVEGRGPRRGPQ